MNKIMRRCKNASWKGEGEKNESVRYGWKSDANVFVFRGLVFT